MEAQETTKQVERIAGWSCNQVAFVAVLFMAAACLICSYLTSEVVGPQLDATWEEVKEHLPWAAEDTLEYFNAGKYPYLPGDVEIPPQLEAMAALYGFTEYDIRALIAAAARWDIQWEHMVAIQMNAKWEGGFRDMFLLGMAIGDFLDAHGYSDEPQPCPTPLSETPTPEVPTPEIPIYVECVPKNPKHEAIKALNPDGGEAWLARVLETAELWAGPLQTATIRPIDPEEPEDLVLIFFEMLSYRIQGYYNELVIVGGLPVIITDPGQPPIPYPDVPDGFIICPYDGCIISGYDFGDPVYNNKGELIREHHPGVDLGGAGRIPVVAACNGTVTYAGWMNSASLWISGIVVAMECFPAPTDPTPICSLYGHGLEGSLQVGVGDEVDAGDWLFTANNTGFSSGDHLHWDIRIGGGPPFCDQPVNPMAFLP